jgi:putative transposase
LVDLDRAFQNFFAGRAAYPTFQKKFAHDSFRFPDPKQFRVDEVRQRIKLPKLGWVSYRNGRGRHALKLLGTIKSVTVAREGKHWFASILCEAEVPEPAPLLGPAVGIDLGVAQSLTLSSGQEPIQIPGMTKAEDRRLARIQRAFARKRKGSHNRAKARARLAEFQARISRRRRDAIHKATTMLAKSHSLVVIEDLRIKNMTKAPAPKPDLEQEGRFLPNGAAAKAGLNKAILDKGWGEIRRQLDYKCRWYGSKLVAVPPAYTSQECSKCHHTEEGNRPTQAEFRCLKCGHEEHADLNAARNILAAGFAASADGTSGSACGARASAGRRSRKVAA